MAYISKSATDESLVKWAKTLRDDKKFLYAVADMLDTVFSKAGAEFIMNAKAKPPVEEYKAVMKYLQELGGFKYKP